MLKEVKHRVLLELGKSTIPYQGLALAAERRYLQRNPGQIDALLNGVAESVAFLKDPANKGEALKSLQKNLRVSDAQQAGVAYEALQSLHSSDLKPHLPGIQNVSRLHSQSNPKLKHLRAQDVVDNAPVRRLENGTVYREPMARANGYQSSLQKFRS